MSLFPMNLRGTRVLLVQSGVAIAVAVLVSGCGSTYRPVVTPINPTGPAASAFIACGRRFVPLADDARHCYDH